MKYGDIKTHSERCDEHPDHQTGIITNQMIMDRLLDEIEELRQYIENNPAKAWEPSDTAHRPGDLPQDFTKHEVENEYDWSEWVSQKPEQYFVDGYCLVSRGGQEANFGTSVTISLDAVGMVLCKSPEKVVVKPPAPHKQQAEPVGWDGWVLRDVYFHDGEPGMHRDPNIHAATQPIYTTPPQRKPLTDEEILDVWKPFEGNPFTTKYEFARAIERAHGIGEKE
jgi:hypothetical protein